MEGSALNFRLVFFALLWGNLHYVTGVRLPLGMTVQGPPPSEGMVVIGDMSMKEELYKNLTTQDNSRKIILKAGTKWPEINGVPTVSYYFLGTQGQSCLYPTNNCIKYGAEIRKGMDHWEEHTCLKFRPDYGNPSLQIINEVGCWSYIGVIDRTSFQQLSIGDGCQSLGIVAHELGHAIGLLHEQSRSDRDNHVRINLENVDDSKRNNFDKYTTSNYGNYSVPYDYTSIMHYSALEFSKNGNPTIATTVIQQQGIIGRGAILSHRDKHIVNIHYNCLGKWLNQCGFSSDPCMNEGYLGKNCLCVCPPGTQGNLCQTRTADYYGNYLSSCSKVITYETQIASPRYPLTMTKDTWCVYHIIAPFGYVVQLTFLDFNLDKYNSSGRLRCATAFLEIRDQDIYKGTVFCGNDIRTNEVFESRASEMILYLDVPYSSNSKGFKANIAFIEKEEETTTTTTKTTTTKCDATLCSPNLILAFVVLAMTRMIGL